MKKNLLTGIIVLMTVSLAGIIAVQYFYISNAVRIKEEQFDQAVGQVLTQAVQRLKKDRDVLFISNHMLDDESGDTEYEYFFNDSVVWTSNSSSKDAPVIIKSSPHGAGISAVSLNANTSGAILSLEALNDDTLRYRTILKLDSIRNELDDDQYVIMTELQDSLELIVHKTLSKVRQKRVAVNKAIDEMFIELKSIDQPLDDSLVTAQISSRLDQSMQDNGIQLEYEFGVYNPQHDSLTPLRSENFSMDRNNLYKTRLFPESIFERPELLLVEFPGHRLHILRSLAWLLSGSVLFTLVILFTFFITIRVILKQKKLSEIKSDFINNMTHEFKTPIATISLAVDSINNPSVISNPDKIKYFTGVIGEENKRMNDRVEGVLQMSMIDSGDFGLQPEMTNMHELIKQAAKNIDLQVEKRKGKMALDLSAEDPVIMADRTHMLGILTNLLDNALKYSTGAPDIIVTTVDNERVLTIQVTDHGIGMSKEEQHRIFDRFYRISQGDIHNVKGFGLGLSYVKAVILAMRGEIDVKSQSGSGSTFILKLPKNKSME